MKMAGRGAPDGDTWPRQLGGAELAELLDRLEIAADPVSPIAELVASHSGSPAAGDDGAPPSEALARALRVLASPRQLLLVRICTPVGEETVLGFASDGEHLVRFDVGEVGCMLAEPCEPGDFALLVCELAGVSADESEGEGVVIGRAFLEAIVALRSLGLFDSAEATLARSEAEALLDEGAGESSPDITDLLGALETDGVLRIDGSTVRPRPEWLEQHRYLTEPARLKIEAIEFGDLAAGRGAAKCLALLGSGAERLVFLPAMTEAANGGDLLELVPPSFASVAHGLERLLAGPLTPPVETEIELSRPLDDWLDGASDEAPSAEWSLDPLEVLAHPGIDSGAPPALLAPEATVEFFAWGPEGRDVERTVLSFDPTSAAEWTLDGSLTRWRPLAKGAIAARIEELVPVGDLAEAAEIDLRVTDFEQLRAALGEGGWPAPSDPDHPLADDGLRIYAIRVGYLAGGARHERFVLGSSGSLDGAWRLEPDGDAFEARSISADGIVAELADALGPGGGDPSPSAHLNGGPRKQDDRA
jgi:hypothetical protein